VKPQPLPLIAFGGHDDEDHDESGGGIRQLRLLLLQPYRELSAELGGGGSSVVGANRHWFRGCGVDPHADFMGARGGHITKGGGNSKMHLLSDLIAKVSWQK